MALLFHHIDKDIHEQNHTRSFSYIKSLYDAALTLESIAQIYIQPLIEKKPLSLSEKTYGFAKKLFTNFFHKEHPSLLNSDESLIQKLALSISTIKKYSGSLSTIAQGNEEEKVLANHISKAILSYNLLVRKLKETKYRTKEIELLLASLRKLKSLSGIFEEEILTSNILHTFQDSFRNQTSEKILSMIQEGTCLQNMEKAQIKQCERDAFIVKAFSLLLNHHVTSFLPYEYIQKKLYESPIDTQLCDVKTDSRAHKSVLELACTQRLYFLPGELITIQGSFHRLSNSLAFSVPVKDSFTLIVNYEQTGFPQSIQHVGIPLHGALLPKHTIQLPIKSTLHEIVSKRNILHNNLMNSFETNKAAKKILLLRQRVYEKYKNDFIPLLEKTMHSMFSDIQNRELHEVISQFFSSVQMTSEPFTYIIETHENIAKNWIYALFEYVENIVLFKDVHTKDQLYTYFTHFMDEKEHVYTSSMSFANKNTLQLHYIHTIGHTLAHLAFPIICGLFADSLQPFTYRLNSNEKKLLRVAFFQQQSFLEEIETIAPKLDESCEILEKFFAEYLKKKILEENALLTNANTNQSTSHQFIQEFITYIQNVHTIEDKNF